MTGQDDDRNSFVRGLTIGAIIGAIVAGSSLWSRRRRGRRREPLPEADAPDGGVTDESPELPASSGETAGR